MVLGEERGYSDYSVLAQLGFGLARAWLALAWLGCDNYLNVKAKLIIC